MGKPFPAFLQILTLFILNMAQPAVALSHADPAPINKETQAVIDKYHTLIPQVMRKQRTPDMAIAIVDDTHGVWAEGFGYPDWNRALPIAVNTPLLLRWSPRFLHARVCQLENNIDFVSIFVPIHRRRGCDRHC